MSYRKIEIEKKVEAVKRVLRGEMATVVAADLGIDRNSLALWMRRALDAIRLNLERKEREKKSVRKADVLRGVARLNRLKEKIASQEKTIAEMRGSMKLFVKAPAPERCPACGCTRLYRRGTGKVHLERLLGKEIEGLDHVIPVQKFTCVNCGCSTHLEGPSALFHWVTESYRQGERRKVHAGGKRSAGQGGD